MKVTLLCDNPAHPVFPYLEKWVCANQHLHDAEVVTQIDNAVGGDILFLISCSAKVLQEDRDRYLNTLVLHASDLPLGRGWSPHIWDLLEGATSVTVTLLEAEDMIDAGKIWQKKRVPIPKNWLWNEINNAIFAAEMELIDFAIARQATITPQDQDAGIAPTYRRKRTIEDSRLSPDLSIADQFDLIRLCDPQRYPAFFDHLGHRYTVKLEKVND